VISILPEANLPASWKFSRSALCSPAVDQNRLKMSSSSSSSTSGTLSSLLSARPLSLPRPASFSVQHDWECVLREYTAAAAKSRGSVRDLPKESKEFWITWEQQANASQEEKRLDAQVKLEDRPANDAAAASSSSTSGVGTSLTAAARAVLPNAGSDLDLQFLGPLQLLAHHRPSLTTQLIQAPRSTLSELHPHGDVFTVDVNVQGTQAISGGLNGTLRTFDAATGTLTKDLKGHAGDVHVARFFPSGSVAISAGLDLGMKIWAVDSGVCAATLNGHSRPVTSISFLERGRHLVTSSEDGTACLWDVSKQAVIATYPRQHKDPFAPKWNDAIVLDPTAHPWELSKEGEVSSENGIIHAE
jgi:WD40 repeat protein